MTTPTWLKANPGLLAVLEQWFTDRTLKGEVRLFFRHGDLTRIEPTPVLDGAALKSARRAESPQPTAEFGAWSCPDCAAPMIEYDYGEKLKCGPCDRTWPRWKVEKMALDAARKAQAGTQQVE